MDFTALRVAPRRAAIGVDWTHERDSSAEPSEKGEEFRGWRRAARFALHAHLILNLRVPDSNSRRGWPECWLESDQSSWDHAWCNPVLLCTSRQALSHKLSTWLALFPARSKSNSKWNSRFWVLWALHLVWATVAPWKGILLNCMQSHYTITFCVIHLSIQCSFINATGWRGVQGRWKKRLLVDAREVWVCGHCHNRGLSPFRKKDFRISDYLVFFTFWRIQTSCFYFLWEVQCKEYSPLYRLNLPLPYSPLFSLLMKQFPVKFLWSIQITMLYNSCILDSSTTSWDLTCLCFFYPAFVSNMFLVLILWPTTN